jgi:hypothetical protein
MKGPEQRDGDKPTIVNQIYVSPTVSASSSAAAAASASSGPTALGCLGCLAMLFLAPAVLIGGCFFGVGAALQNSPPPAPAKKAVRKTLPVPVVPVVAGEPGDPIPLPELPAELFPDGDRPPPGPPPRIEPPPAPAPDLRDWTSADGRFSVAAEFRGVLGGNVKLKKADGTELNVPLDSLSEADREWIEDRRK